MKKIISLLLTLAMVLTMMPAYIYADGIVIAKGYKDGVYVRDLTASDLYYAWDSPIKDQCNEFVFTTDCTLPEGASFSLPCTVDINGCSIEGLLAFGTNGSGSDTPFLIKDSQSNGFVSQIQSKNGGAIISVENVHVGKINDDNMGTFVFKNGILNQFESSSSLIIYDGTFTSEIVPGFSNVIVYGGKFHNKVKDGLFANWGDEYANHFFGGAFVVSPDSVESGYEIEEINVLIDDITYKYIIGKNVEVKDGQVVAGQFAFNPDEFLADGFNSIKDEEYWNVVKTPVAQISNGVDTETYTSLADAVSDAQTGDTITLLDNCSGDGIEIDKSLTIDLNGKTYTVCGPNLAGSQGTETQGFQLLKDNTITIKNGKINTTAEANAKILIQNYANLTLDNVILDGTNLIETKYTSSNNNGTVVYRNGTKIIAAEGGVAFDAYGWYKYYPNGVIVTIEDGVIVDGVIEIDKDATEGKEYPTVTVPSGYVLHPVDEKQYVLKSKSDYVAQICEGSTAKEFFTLEEAIAKVPDNNTNPVTIELLKDIVLTEAVNINKNNVVIDGKNLTISADENQSEWQKYKIGGNGANDNSVKFGQIDLVSVTGQNVTVKNVTVDVNDYRGISCLTTKGGENVTYENVTYKGRGSGHYYGYGKGTITFTNCDFNTKGYAVHSSSENPDYSIIIDGSTVHGWNSFGGASKIIAKNSTFYGANDEGKNGLLAKFRPYSNATIINCKFSEDYLSEATTYCGIDSGAETLVMLNGCSVIKNDGTASTHQVYELIDYRESDVATENQGDCKSTIFAIDAKGDATSGYTAGTFVTMDGTVNPAEGYELNEIATLDTTAKVYTVTAKAVVDENSGDITVGGNEITVTGIGGGENQPNAEQAATAITKTLNNPEVTTFTETKIEEATPSTKTVTVQENDDLFDLSMVLNEVKKEASERFKDGEVKASNDGEITVKTSSEGEGEKFVDTDVTKQITVDLTAAAVTQTVAVETTTTVTSMIFDVKPVATITVTDGEGKSVTVTAKIPNEAIVAPITFRLPVDKKVDKIKYAKAFHIISETEGTEKTVDLGYYDIKYGTQGKYIELSSKTFSNFGYELAESNFNPVARIGEAKYGTLEAAVAAVKTGEIIVLLKDSNEEITVNEEKSFTVNEGENSFTGTISAGSGYKCIPAKNEKVTVYTITGLDDGGDVPSPVVIMFEPNGGKGTMKPVPVVKGASYTLPPCDFTAPLGKKFVGWAIDEEPYAVGATVNIIQDTRVVAQWSGDDDLLKKAIGAAAVGAAVVGTGALIANAMQDATKPAEPVAPVVPVIPEKTVCLRDYNCPLYQFSDLDVNKWYHDGIHYILDSGLMNGVGAGKFNPDGKTTRPMMMTILARMDGNDTAGGATWDAVGKAWAMTNGISEGIADSGNITREEFATMLYRYAKLQGEGFTGSWMFLLDFKDADKISSFANEAMHWCVMKGILNGRTGAMEGMLDPQGELTRAEAAAMIQRFIDATK